MDPQQNRNPATRRLIQLISIHAAALNSRHVTVQKKE
jgi:hypothetical protein